MRRPEQPVKPTTSNALRLAASFAAALLVIAAGVLLYSFVSPKSGTTGSGAGNMTLEYASEAGQGANQGAPNSPLRITLRVPYNGIEDSQIDTASVQLLGEDGSPAEYGGKVEDPFLLQPSYELGVWNYSGSVPGKPGKYHAHVVLSFRGSGGAVPTPQAADFPATVLESRAESGPPVTSGFVFTQDSNLWVLSTDTTKQRRLTYFPTQTEYANDASWSPDGKTVVFSHTPKSDQSQLPATDIWTVGADGKNAHMILAHGENESLYEPSYSADGKNIYFTAEKLDMASTNYDANGTPVGERGIDRLEIATGARTHWKDNAHTPVANTSDGSILYLGTPASTGISNTTTTGVKLVREKPDGSSSNVIVDDTSYRAFYGPTLSPDGSRVVFAGIEMPAAQPKSEVDLFRWLTFQPDTAYAHGLPWDLYSVPANGNATPTRITNMNEDQPHAAWLGNSTIAFMGVSGLYKLEMDSTGNPTGKPQKIHEGATHGGLNWHAP